MRVKPVLVPTRFTRRCDVVEFPSRRASSVLTRSGELQASPAASALQVCTSIMTPCPPCKLLACCASLQQDASQLWVAT